ncbi:helix-turn-helix domain-containing protein, partial [Kordia jejudonensis]|uniref:helix-turn-helix domain-containing protein n=1 Tax=Kordia jejudonensis TaxID=1348245 RepID=UPI00138DFAE7
MAKKSGNSTDLFNANKRYGIIENNKGNHEKAFEYIDISKKIAREDLKDKNLETLSIFLKGKFFYDYGKYEESFDNYKEAYNFYKDNNKRMALLTSNNIALIENILDDQKAALKILLENYQNIIEASKTNKNAYHDIDHINTLLAISDTYIKYGNNNTDLKNSLLDSAEIYNNIGLEKIQKSNDESGHIYFLAEKGIIDYARGNYLEAISQLNHVKNKAIKENNNTLFQSIYYYLAASYKELNDRENAITYFRKTDSVSKKNATNYILLNKTYYNLIDLYNKKGNKKDALKYWESYQENNRINEHISNVVKTSIKDHNIENLEEEIKKLLLTKEEKETNYSIALIVIVILIFLLLIYIVYSKKKTRLNQIKFDTLLRELETKKNAVQVKREKKISTLTIDEEKVQKILTELTKFEQKKQFLDVNCDLAFVAKKTKTNKAYLSKVIHAEKQQKFIQYITNLRINYALEKLKEDKLFRSYDIKSIASELGFKSPDSFSRAFKNKTGIY